MALRTLEYGMGTAEFVAYILTNVSWPSTIIDVWVETFDCTGRLISRLFEKVSQLLDNYQSDWREYGLIYSMFAKNDNVSPFDQFE